MIQFFCEFFFTLRYSITDAGCELAHKLEAVKGDDVDRGGDIPFRIYDPQAPAARASPVTSPQPRPAARLPDLPASPRQPQLPDLDDNGNIDVADFGSTTTPR